MILGVTVIEFRFFEKNFSIALMAISHALYHLLYGKRFLLVYSLPESENQNFKMYRVDTE